MRAFAENHPALVGMFRTIGVCVIVVAIVNALGFFRSGSAGVDFDIDDDSFTVYYNDEFVTEILREEILSVALFEEWDFGEPVEPISESGYLAGIWENDTLGEYRVCANTSIDSYIVIETGEGTSVINYQSADATNGMYEGFVDWQVD